MTLYAIFYKETKKSEWSIFRLLMSKEDAKNQIQFSTWYRAKLKPITAPLDLAPKK